MQRFLQWILLKREQNKFHFLMRIMTAQQVYVALKGKADLASAKTIGVQNGTTFQQYTAAETKQYNAKSYASLQDAILDFKKWSY